MQKAERQKDKLRKVDFQELGESREAEQQDGKDRKVDCRRTDETQIVEKRRKDEAQAGPLSIYQKKSSSKKTMMSVHEMGDLLGLKKTERYWLLHKEFFTHKVVLGKTWIEIESFEKWYANQVKYKKVTGEEPGKELKARSYSVWDLAQELGVNECTVYEIIKRENLEMITVDYCKRVPREVWEAWYRTQSRYRMKADREKDAQIENASITMPEMARLLGITRGQVYSILKHPAYKDVFEMFVLAEKKRITKESFRKFLEMQDRYQLAEGKNAVDAFEGDYQALEEYRRRAEERWQAESRGSGNWGETQKSGNRFSGNTGGNAGREVNGDFASGKHTAGRRAAGIEGTSKTRNGKKVAKGERSSGNGSLKYDAGNSTAVAREPSVLNMRNDGTGSDSASYGMAAEEGKQIYLTRNEAAKMAGVAPSTITKWYEKGMFPVKSFGSVLRIPREAFEAFLEKRNEED